METTLLYMPYSPWSQKARSALRHHGLRPRERIYTPLLGEPWLRWRLGKWRGRVTVPVLFTPDGALSDSWEIARYAEGTGSSAPLFPADKLSEIADWNACSERLLSAGRGGAMLRVLEAPDAALEYVPPAVGKLIGASGALLAARSFNAKYGIRAEQRDAYRAAAHAELSRLRSALADRRRYLLGTFSYADIAMAIAVGVLRPLAETPLGPSTRRVAPDASLAAEFPELLDWRDAIHASHPLAA